MKDFNEKELSARRPGVDPGDALDHVLEALYRDRTKLVTENVVAGLTFEERIGALLVARDRVHDA
jgi:hypothetical protein